MKPGRLPACIAVALATVATAAIGTPAPAIDWAVRLGAALAIDGARLEKLEASSERLGDGREIVTVKAIDRVSGEVVGRSFLQGSVVDRDLLSRESDIRWRFAHGAMTPALVAKRDALSPHASLVVDLWFAFEAPESIQASGGRDGVADGHVASGGTPAATTAGSALSAADATALDAAASGDAVIQTGAIDADKPAMATMDAGAIAVQKADAVAAIAAAENANQFRIAEVKAAMAGPRQAMLDKLAAAGVTIHYASDLVPSIIVETTRSQLERIARWHDVAQVDLVAQNAGPSLAIARPAHNITPINALGYDGGGVTVAVVEGGRVYALNPFLAVSQTRDSALASVDHTTEVAGVIASTHATEVGMASGATLISADGVYSIAGMMETATDWAAARAQVLNHSWGNKNDPGTSFIAFDRRLDYIGRVLNRLNVHAAGNNGAINCGQTPASTPYGVESPGRGFNTLTVGGFNDGGTQAWASDTIYGCTSFTNPVGDSAAAAHEKPEVVASAVGITSLARTTSSTSPLSGAVTGTSFAAPAVAGLAATLMEADAQLATSPVATRALIIAGAARDIAGGAPISDQDGAGAISGTASAFSTEAGPWAFSGVDASSFPRSVNVYARAGQRVRFVINWLSNVTLSTGTYSNDRLPADLDLRAFRSNGSEVASSTSSYNAFEVVDFIAPVDDTYEMRTTLFGSWTGSAVPYASAANLDGYLIPRGSWWTFASAPGRQGRFFDIRPTSEYSGAVFNWRGVSLRPAATADFDLELYGASWFGEPTSADTFNRPLLASSSSGTGAVDFIMVDGNHWPTSQREFYRAKNFGGSGAFTINAANLVNFDAIQNGTYGPYSLDANSSLWVGDIAFDAASERRISVIPGSGAGSSDFGLSLYRSDPASPASWAQPRSQSVSASDNAGAGVGEQTRYRNSGASDYLGMAVYNKTFGTAPQFFIKVTPSALFASGFDSF